MTQGKLAKPTSNVCSKHGMMKHNFWSDKQSGVIWGCPECDMEEAK